MLKRYPDLPVGGLIREKLTDHLGRLNLEGELSFFKDAGAFERPYGYAWLLKLQSELANWKDPEGTRWADNVAPLAKYFADSLLAFLVDLDRPNKAATQANTAFALGLLLDYVDVTHARLSGRATCCSIGRAADRDRAASYLPLSEAALAGGCWINPRSWHGSTSSCRRSLPVVAAARRLDAVGTDGAGRPSAGGAPSAPATPRSPSSRRPAANVVPAPSRRPQEARPRRRQAEPVRAARGGPPRALEHVDEAPSAGRCHLSPGRCPTTDSG